MSPEKQRIAIAEVCGLNPVTIPFVPNQIAERWFSPEAAHEWFKCYPSSGTVKIIPDYLSSLDAMHEAEKVLSLKQWWDYCDNLIMIVDQGLGNESHVHANAAQRCEAFLKTIGKWIEEPTTKP